MYLRPGNLRKGTTAGNAGWDERLRREDLAWMTPFIMDPLKGFQGFELSEYEGLWALWVYI